MVWSCCFFACMSVTVPKLSEEQEDYYLSHAGCGQPGRLGEFICGICFDNVVAFQN